MPRGEYESLDDYARRRRKSRSGRDRAIGASVLLVVIGSAALAVKHGGWVRVGLLGIVPALVVIGLCNALYRLRPLRFIVMPIGGLILLGFPALWAESVLFALTSSRTWSIGVAIVVLFGTPSLLLAWQRWARRRKRDQERLQAETST
jgi:hypothetical protein